MAMIPDLEVGNYNIKVVSQYSGGGNLLKAFKTFTYSKLLKFE